MDARKLLRGLGRMERKLKARMRSMVRRATASNVNSDGQGQTLQTKALADDVRDEVEYFEAYGFTSSPPVGCEGLVFNVGGDTANAIAALFGNRTLRPSGIGAGEVAVYHQSGSILVMRDDGSIEVYPAAGQVVRLGAEGGLPVARETDPVHREPGMVSWMTAVETTLGIVAGLLNTAGPVVGAPGTITPANLPTPVVEPFARINQGGEGSEST